jgi:uncharacterized protein (DUF1800 family)
MKKLPAHSGNSIWGINHGITAKKDLFMKRLPVFLVFLLLMGLLSSAAFGISFEEARHLLARTGFGGDWEQIQRLKSLGYEEAVTAILNQTRSQPLTAPPDWVSEPLMSRQQIKQLSKEARKKLFRQKRMRSFELKAWWFHEMVQTDSPISEQMTLFWHNHFTSGLRKVNSTKLMYAQNLLLRQHALGNFRQLIHAVAKDPAMLIYLDNVFNQKGKPNENFARELLELFTLGEGHYTEKDIKEAARAFTGWAIDRRSGKFRFIRRRHDFGSKTFMGRAGNFDGDDIIDMVLEQPQVASTITEKIWRAFISQTPDPQEVSRLASLLRANDYELKPLMQSMLTSRAFRDPQTYGAMIKSPVDLIVGTLRVFQFPMGDGRGIVQASRRLGQDLMDPPNVKGWPGGTRWISSDTLMMRRQILDRFLRGMEMLPARKNVGLSTATTMPGPIAGMKVFGKSMSHKTITKVLLPLPPIAPAGSITDRQELISERVQDPVYQLK